MVLLRVVPVPHSVGTLAPGVISSVPPVPPLPEQLAEEETKVKEYLDGNAKSLKESGIKVECVAITGNPGEAIVNYANNDKLDCYSNTWPYWYKANDIWQRNRIRY
jgi:hypothetical protein